jgi:ATP synthase protein I
MSDPSRRIRGREEERFAERVRAEERRKARARRMGERGVWFGLGMFGLVGWSVAIPTLIGVALGLWLDARFEEERSWTLAMLGLGVGVGALNAWFWVRRESREPEDERMERESDRQSDGESGGISGTRDED